MKNKPFKYILLCIFLVLFLCQYVISHELIHGEIQRHHGCTNTTYGVNWDSAYTKCNHYNNRTEAVRLQEKNLHCLNEIIGYYLPVLIGLIFLMILFYMINKDLK
jgi:hypothetical protein